MSVLAIFAAIVAAVCGGIVAWVIRHDRYIARRIAENAASGKSATQLRADGRYWI